MAVIKIPGMVDPHVHLRGMDWSHKGTFASETAAAITSLSVFMDASLR